MQPFAIYNTELFRIYVLGESAHANKDLKRPWKAASAMKSFKELKREVQREMGGDNTKASRKNKKQENLQKTR